MLCLPAGARPSCGTLPRRVKKPDGTGVNSAPAAHAIDDERGERVAELVDDRLGGLGRQERFDRHRDEGDPPDEGAEVVAALLRELLPGAVGPTASSRRSASQPQARAAEERPQRRLPARATRGRAWPLRRVGAEHEEIERYAGDL